MPSLHIQKNNWWSHGATEPHSHHIKNGTSTPALSYVVRKFKMYGAWYWFGIHSTKVRSGLLLAVQPHKQTREALLGGFNIKQPFKCATEGTIKEEYQPRV